MFRCAISAFRNIRPLAIPCCNSARIISNGVKTVPSCRTIQTLPSWSVPQNSLLNNIQVLNISNKLNQVPVRTVTKFSLKRAKRKTVKAVVRRFFRLQWGGWIRTKCVTLLKSPIKLLIMKIVQFVYNNNPNNIRVGFLDGENIIDVNKADCRIPSTVIDILKNDDFEMVKRLKYSSLPSVPLSSVTLKAPITGMDKVLCVGMNYRDFCEAKGLPYPEVPVTFNKFPYCIIGTNDVIRIRTDVTKEVLWEVELTIVIGKTASNVSAANAYNYIFGYTVAQDITAMDWLNKNGGHVLLAKAQDTFCPIGPCITTSDEIGDPHTLNIKCSVNGVVKQSSNTEQMIHKVPEIVERLSSVMTLFPGDIILTGAPRDFSDPNNIQYLKPGDTLTTEIENIGVLDLTVGKY